MDGNERNVLLLFHAFLVPPSSPPLPSFPPAGINDLEGVVMLASTNRVDILDHALLRPGRFDRQIAIDLPTLPERKAIFEVYLRRILLQKAVETYSSRLAALTPGHSGEGCGGRRREGEAACSVCPLFAASLFSLSPFPTLHTIHTHTTHTHTHYTHTHTTLARSRHS